MEYKVCTRCGINRPINNYYPKYMGSKSLLRTECMNCGKERSSKWYNTDLSRSRKIGRNSYARNRSKIKERVRMKRLELKEEVYYHYGRICKCCSEDNILFLSIDHIDGGGTQHRKDIGGGNKLYKWLIKNGYPEGYQILCMNCNYGKRMNNGICPHKDSK